MTNSQQTRGHRKKEKTRAQLVAAGLRVLATKGEGLVASDVTAEADVAIGTFYNYFADRDALIDVITEEQLHTLAATASTFEKPIPDPALRVALTAAAVLHRAATDDPWARLVMRLVSRPTIYNRINGFLRDDLAEGLAQGRFNTKPDDATLDQITGLLVMTIRRIAAGEAKSTTASRAVARCLRALGVPEDEAADLAKTAARMIVRKRRASGGLRSD